MDYKANNCKNCGCSDLKLVSHKVDGTDIFYVYRCLACGEVFSTEPSYLSKQQISNLTINKSEDDKLNALSGTEIYKQCREFVVEIFTSFKECIYSGTGILLGDGYILTNAHVVINNKKDPLIVPDIILCKLANNKEVELDLVYANIEKDLALLFSLNIKNLGAKFDKRKLETGEKVYAIGNTKGQGICIMDGLISDKERLLNNEKYIMYSVPTMTGNSGGPLFDVFGKIIGVVTLGIKDAISMNFAIPIKTIEYFINEANDKEELDARILY